MIEAYDAAIEKELLRGQMKVVCAWCGKTMREAQPGHEKDDVSHGICAECLAEEKDPEKDPHTCALNCVVHGVPQKNCPICRGRTLEVSA